MKYKQVTSGEWADFCFSFRTYATDGCEGKDHHLVRYDKLSQGPMVDEIIGVVHYHHNGSRTYEIWDMPAEEKAK